MPKRKRVECEEDDYDYLKKKLRKLERRIKSGRKRRRDSSLSSYSDNLSLRNPEECDSIATDDDDVIAPEVGCSYWNCWPEPSEPSEVDAQACPVFYHATPPPAAQPAGAAAAQPPAAAAQPAAAATQPAAAAGQPCAAASVQPCAAATSSVATAVTPAQTNDTLSSAENVRSTVVPVPTAHVAEPINTASVPLSSASAAVAPDQMLPHQSVNSQTEVPTQTLDPDLLAILGEDPTAVKEYGEDIQNDLAVRLNHLATSGLNKESRKEIKDKYHIPGNCKMIKAPTLNPEIRASLVESQVKRDKGIENKQVLNSCALSSLSKAITLILSAEDKNPEVLKLLMDTARILGDIQHSDSILRRFFILSTVKKELKDQLEKTKIEDLLFGSNLAETLKSARNINKSGADMRAAPAPAKVGAYRPGSVSNKPLNIRAPPANRRPAPAGGTRQARPATQPAPTPRRPTTTRHSSRPSSRQPYTRPRR